MLGHLGTVCVNRIGMDLFSGFSALALSPGLQLRGSFDGLAKVSDGRRDFRVRNHSHLDAMRR